MSIEMDEYEDDETLPRLSLSLDEDDDEENEDDIVFLRKKNGRKTYEIHIQKMKEDTNPFIGDPNEQWGKDDVFSTFSDISHFQQQSRRRLLGGERSQVEHSRNPEGEDGADVPFEREGRRRFMDVVNRDSEDEDFNEEDALLMREERMKFREYRNQMEEDRQKKSICEILNVREYVRKELEKKRPKSKIRTLFRQVLNLISKYRRKFSLLINPFSWIVLSIERTYGTGIASFFDLWVWIIYMNVGIFVITFFMSVLPWMLRSDMKLTDKLEPFGTFEFFIGLIGFDSSEIGRTFFFYGGYHTMLEKKFNTTMDINGTTSSEWEWAPYDAAFKSRLFFDWIPYEFRFFYPLSIILIYILCLIVLVISVGRRMRIVNKMDKEMKYSTAILTLWDHSVSGKSAVHALRKTIASTFREYMEIDKEKEMKRKRSIARLCCVLFFRTIGWTLTLIIVVISPVSVYFISSYYKIINSKFKYTDTILITIISTMMPKACDFIVDFLERYSSPIFATRKKTLQTYVIKLSVLISAVVATLFTNDGEGDEDYCTPTDAGVQFWKLVLSDCIFSIINNVGSNFLMLFINRGKEKNELSISGSLNKVLYRQTIIWVGTIVSPMLPFIGIITSIILFYFRVGVMFVTMGFPKRPISNARGNFFNQLLFLFTLCLCLIPTITFFIQSDFHCGPAWKGSLWDGLLIWRKSSGVQLLVDILDTILDYLSLILGCLLGLVVIVCYLLYQRFKMSEEMYAHMLHRMKEERKVVEDFENRLNSKIPQNDY